jgi:hypothetical protein
VGELVSVSGEAVRLWETGDREPSGENGTAYLELVNRLATPQEPQPEPVDMPEPETLTCNATWTCTIDGPHRHCTAADLRAARGAAPAGHRAKMAHLTGRSA